LVWELLQRGLDALPFKAQPCDVLRRPVRRSSVVIVKRIGAPTLFAANEVDRASMDERQDPGARLRLLGQEVVGAAPHSEEALLHRILGKRLVAQNTVGKRVRRTAIAVVQLGQCRLVRSRCKSDDGFV
jgi:hypothetical protein